MPNRDADALGLVETRGLIPAIVAADAMGKAAAVEVIGIERAEAGLVTVQVAGEVAAVKAAVEAGSIAAHGIGTLVGVHVIPRPARDVWTIQSGTVEPAPTLPSALGGQQEPEASGLASLSVKALRARVRAHPGIDLQGRAVSRATKQQLIEALINAQG